MFSAILLSKMVYQKLRYCHQKIHENLLQKFNKPKLWGRQKKDLKMTTNVFFLPD